MKPDDILYLVDFPRYDLVLEKLALQAAKHQHARIVRMTGKWVSPITKHAREVMPIDIGRLWDMFLAAFAVTEAIVTCSAEHNWDKTPSRMLVWEALRLTPKEDPI